MRRTLSFVRALELAPEPCEPAALLRAVADSFSGELRGGKVRLEVRTEAGLPPVRADRGLLEDVLGNLVRNAIEAIGVRGRVELRARAASEDHVLLEVEDDGPGLAPSIRSELFKPFVTSKSTGTGLGLAIARKIVLEHGGEIGTSDGTLGGACFWIRLPTWSSTS